VDELDRKLIIAMQEELPLVPEPYAEIAQKLGITEDKMFERLKVLTTEGRIRKMGAVLTHRQLGYAANALCAWIVPDQEVETVGKSMAAHEAVTHCYCREKNLDWPYNFYTMIHGKSRDICEGIAQQLSLATGVDQYILLFSTKEWKKTSMRYFQET